MKGKINIRKIICRMAAIVVGLIAVAVLLLVCVPFFEHVDKTPVGGSADWMAELEDSLLLSEINLPGTHDSATNHIELGFFSRCQDLSVAEQLEGGFRYLDIRLGAEEEKMKLMHSFTSAKKTVWPWSEDLLLEDVLAECYAFLEKHPTETVVFVVKQEYGEVPAAEFESLLCSYIIKNPDYWYWGNTIPTLSEVRGKLVLMRRYEGELGVPYESQVQDGYELDTEEKWEAFTEFLTYCETEAPEGVHINFLSTKGSLTYGHPYYFAHALNAKFLDTTLTSGKKYGWIILDFANPLLAEHIYSTNE